MFSLFNDFSLMYDENHIRIPHRGKTMGNYDGGSALDHLLHGSLYFLFRYCIDGRNGFTFNPADNDSVAAALMKLLALGKEGLKAFGAESRRIAEEKLSKERFIGEWLDVLDLHLYQC